ncbi:MAG TPA: HAMP domain-containing sensor histidine kinase [Oligoflexus sp.]|uniref:sensor histidine kinase n=1 Tax=Oligoflexus sp. TaxID=1971216 RepID=UPI002D476F21|nr:HAMP domain-containing sensor histidine kinase [Oligoflexus sp.]HYX34527.1 HAMP domain-containing sensor histidine kinase [Oligoflexus sp.]
MTTASDHLGSYGFLPTRWEEQHISLYAKYANLICVALMLLCAPTDFVSFPQTEAWQIVQARAVAVAIFLFLLALLPFLAKNPKNHKTVLTGILCATTLTINGLYIHFLLSMDPQHRLAVTTGCLTAILGTHLFLYKFRRAHAIFSLIFLSLILALSFRDAVWRSYLISILLGHATGFILTLFFRKVFYDGLRKNYKIKLQSETIRKQSEKIESAYREKETLLRVLIHDIATPLCVITISQSSIMNSASQLDDETNRALERMQKACESLDHLIHHVRTTEAIRSGKVEIVIGPCSVHEAVDSAILMLEPQAQAKNIRIQVQQTVSEDLYCVADKLNLTHQVLGNIISNAVKFSRPGGLIEILIQKLDDAVEIGIRDHGIGIPAPILAEIFHQHRSTSRPGTAGEIGTGFGMPLAKAYMDRFQGQIRIISVTPDEAPHTSGTTVFISLPLASLHPSQ